MDEPEGQAVATEQQPTEDPRTYIQRQYDQACYNSLRACERYRAAEIAKRKAIEQAEQRDVELEIQKSYRGESAGDLIRSCPKRRPYRIDGLLREGEILNVIAAPKQGKSWSIYGLLLAAADGGQWFGRDVTPGPVLLIDNELHRDELAYRLREVAWASTLDLDQLEHNLEIRALRGQPHDLSVIESMLAVEYMPGDFSLIVIDAFYRILPEGTNENDNGHITQIYNRLDAIAEKSQAAIVQVHHASKGDQSGKAVTDVGSGAGAMTRATDTHIIIRPHEEPNLAVLEAVTRSSVRPDAITAEFEWPLWHVRDAEPVLKKPKTAAARKQEEDNKAADTEVLEQLEGGKWRSKSWIDSRVTFGRERCQNALNRLVRENRVTRRFRKAKSNGGKTAVYRVNNDEN